MAPAAHGAHKLRVITSGDGTVTSSDGRIGCGDDCSATYPGASQITPARVRAGHDRAATRGAAEGRTLRAVDVVLHRH
jgi:hypothetical protein